MAEVVAGGRAVLCVLLLLAVYTSPVSADKISIIANQVVRQPGPEGFTEVLEDQQFWLRDAFYRLTPAQQLTFRLCSAQVRDRAAEMLNTMPGMERRQAFGDLLTYIGEAWKDTDGFDVKQEAEDIAARDALLQDRRGGIEDDAATGRMSGALAEADDTADADEGTESQPPVVVAPVRQFALPSLWELLAEARRAGNDTGLWRLSLSGDEDLALTAVRRLDPTETVSLLPLYGRRSDARPELVQVTFSVDEASLQQLLRLPDELLRTLPAGAAARLPARTLTALSVEHAGDVTVTGALAASGAENMTDAQLETLVHSLLQRPLAEAELSALTAVIGRHWPQERGAWSPSHVSVLAAHRCELLAHVSLPALLPLDADTVDGLVRSCQAVWPPAADRGPALGPYVRRWLRKALARRGPLAGWSASALSELSEPLLVGALPEELAQLGAQSQQAAGAALSFAGLDRAQAQPVIGQQLEAAENLPAAATLYELLRHLQPRHVRRLARLHRRLPALARWLMKDSEKSGQYATHLQFRLMLDPHLDRANVSAEDLARLGPFFYTLPLAEVFTRVVEPRLQLTAAQLAGIASPRLEEMTRRLLMAMFILPGDKFCRGCLRGVPAELLGAMTDGTLTQMQRRGLLDAATVAELVPAADYMLAGKRAELLEAVRRLLRRGGGEVSPSVVAGGGQLWTLAGPTDMPLLVPAVIARMEELARHVDAAQLVRAAAQYPRPLLAQVLAHYRAQHGVWSSESLLGRRPGRRRPPHGPWVYLAGLSCADVAAVTPLDLPAAAEAYEQQLRAGGDPHMPLAVCVCLQQRLVLYLQVRHAMGSRLNATDARQLALSELEDAPLHRMSVSEVRAVPACVLVLMPRHYLQSLSREARLAAWRKIGRLTWPAIATHISVQQNAAQFRWVARQMVHDMNVTNGTELTFEHVAQLNQLLHFVEDDAISRIAPEAFREWIYTLRSGSERLVCRPHPAWTKLISRAFGPAASWNMSTPYYLGGWIFALNSTERGRISRKHLRLAVDDHNTALFQKLPDVVGRHSGGTVTFLEACRGLNDTALDLRPLFEASRLAGVVGYPRPRGRRSVWREEAVSPADLRRLRTDLITAIRSSTVSARVRGQAEVLIDEMVTSIGDGSAPEEPDPLPFEFVPTAGGPLTCDDLRAAGPAAAAVRPHELAQMADTDRTGLWSCLNALGRLRWPLGGQAADEVWQAVRAVNGDRLLPDNLVHLGGLVAAFSPDELRRVQVAAPYEPLSTDALSMLGEADWSPDQLTVLVNSTLRVTEDPRTSRVRLYAEPQSVTALGSLLCGFTPGQLRRLFNGSRPHLYRDTAAAVGRLGGCPDRVLETLAELAVETFGPTSTWTELTVATAGVAAAGLRRWQFEDLPAAALRGLTPVAARRAAASVLATGLSPEQLRQLTPSAARELMAQPGLTTRQMDALRHALLGRRSARAAPDPPPPRVAPAPAPAEEPRPEPEPHPDSRDPDADSEDDHQHEDSDPASEPEPSAEPRDDSGRDSGDSDSEQEEQEEPDSQGVTQERANSTAPAPPAAHAALWITALVLVAPAA